MSDLRPLAQKIIIKGREFDIAFNLNIMDTIQDETGLPVAEFIGDVLSSENCKFKELRYLLYLMINEGIEIWNDEHPHDTKQKLKLHQVGALLDLEGISDIMASITYYILSTFPQPDNNTPSN